MSIALTIKTSQLRNDNWQKAYRRIQVARSIEEKDMAIKSAAVTVGCIATVASTLTARQQPIPTVNTTILTETSDITQPTQLLVDNVQSLMNQSQAVQELVEAPAAAKAEAMQAQKEAEAMQVQKVAEEAEAMQAQKVAEEAEAMQAQKAAEDAEAMQAQKEAEAMQAQKAAEEAEAMQVQKVAEEAEAMQAQKAAEEAEAMQAQKAAEEAEAMQAQKEAEAMQAQKAAEEAEAMQAQKEAEEAQALQEALIAEVPEAEVFAVEEPVTEAQVVATSYYSPTASELDFLYKLVYAESGNQPGFGQTLVANAIINRARSSGQSIIQVGCAPKQFSPVKNGVPCVYRNGKWVPVTEKMLSADLKANVDTALEKDWSVEVLKRAAAEKGITDPKYWEGGVRYFYNPKACSAEQNAARDNVTVKITIADHTFYAVWK